MSVTVDQASSGRYLIVNADDFGASPATNAGIVEAHVKGIVTSASLMVDRQGAADAARRAREIPRLAVGLHLDLGEWRYRDGEWEVVSQPVDTDDAAVVREEIFGQLERFQSLMGRAPTHLDSHQHVHQDEPVRGVALEMADRLAVPLRGVRGGIAYCGAFYGQSGRGEPCPEAITIQALVELLTDLPSGITELACHPGLDDQLPTEYRIERPVEVEVLCSPAVRSAVLSGGIELVSFADMAHQSISARAPCDR
jgi:chitin disaccharide deacetylase